MYLRQQHPRHKERLSIYYSKVPIRQPSNNTEEKDDTDKEVKPGDNFSEFAWETTLHGVKRISHSSFRTQRIAWAILFVLCCFGAFWQLKDKIISYIRTPVVLDIDREYKTEMEFPAVLVCNANLFRITQSVKKEWDMYDVIHELYNGSITYNQAFTQKYPYLNEINMTAFRQEAAHQKEDLIQYCRWPDGRECNHTAFEPIFTDYGVCYVINKKETGKRYNMTHPGSDHGLYMLLNTENYEVMPGPQQTIGVKVLIYDPNEYPLVSEEGFDVAPGFQTSVGIAYHQTERLPINQGGTCYHEWEMKYFPNTAYSRKLCIVNKRFDVMINECGCLPMSLISTEGKNISTCSAAKYVRCIEPQNKKTIVITEEDCPHQCLRLDYQEFISFSYLATININNLITEERKDEMKQKFLDARETRSRWDYAERDMDNELIKDLKETSDKLRNASFHPGDSIKTSVDDKVLEVSCYNDSLAPLLKLDSFCSMERISDFEAKPRQIKNTELAKTMHELFNQVNQSHIDLMELKRRIEITVPYNRQRAGRIRHFRQTDDIRTVVQHEIQLVDVKNHIRHIRSDLERYGPLIKDRREPIEIFLDETKNNSASNEYLHGNISEELHDIEQCLAKLSAALPDPEGLQKLSEANIYDLVISTTSLAEKCKTELQGLHVHLKKYESEIVDFNKNYISILDKIKAICESAENFRSIGTKEIKAAIKDDRFDTEEIIWGSRRFQNLLMTKAEFAQHVLQLANRAGFPMDMETQNKKVGQRTATISGYIDELETSLDDMLAFYNETSYTSVLQEAFQDGDLMLPPMIKSAQECLPDMSNGLSDIESEASGLHDEYLKRVDRLRSRLQRYNDSLVIDTEFYRRNLLALNIYLQEMSVGVLRQIKSYDAFSLLCDVGGTLGLFLGASVLTLAEVLEWIFVRFRCCSWLRKGKKDGAATKNNNNNKNKEIPAITVTNNDIDIEKGEVALLTKQSSQDGVLPYTTSPVASHSEHSQQVLETTYPAYNFPQRLSAFVDATKGATTKSIPS